MMRNRSLKYCIPIFVLGIAVLSCNRESLQPDSHEMVFSVQMAGETKAAGLFTDTELSGLTEFNVTGYDGDSKVINDRTLYKVDGVWKFKDNPLAWLDGHTMTFWSKLNIPTWATATLNNIGQATLTVGSSGIPTAVNDQWDPLIGYYSGTGVNGKATITFYHPLTAVVFKTGDCDTEHSGITGIKSITMKGAYKTGTATISGGKGVTTPTVTWSSCTDAITTTGAFSGEASAKPFLLIPQDLSIRNVTLEVTVTRSTGDDKTMYATIKSGSWVAGETNIYTLDYVNDRMEATLTVTLENWGKVINKQTDPNPDLDYFEAKFD